MKKNWRPYGLALLLLGGLVLAGLTTAAAPGPTLPVVQVGSTVTEHAVLLEVKGSAPFDYKTYRPSQSLFVVDLKGVAPQASDIAQVLRSDIVSSYRVLQYQDGQDSAVRLEVLLRTPVQPRLKREGRQTLVLTFAESAARPATPMLPAAAAAVKTVAAKAATSAVPSNVSSTIEHVIVVSGNGQTEVRVGGNSPLAYHVMRLGNPERLVLDFAGTRIGMVKARIPANVPPVREIRLGQDQPDMARVVIDLQGKAPYSVQAAGNSVRVLFRSASADAPVAQKAATETAQPVVAAAQPLVAQSEPDSPRISSAETVNRPALVPASLQVASEPQVAPAAQPQPTPVPAAPPEVTAPVTTQPQPEAAAQSQAPAPAPEAPPARPEASAPQEPTPAPAAAPTPAPAPAPTPRQAPTGTKPSGKFTGEPVSVNLKDVDLKDFFRLIHEISGLNVVLDPAVKGTLTIVLDDVPWDQALDIVLRNNGLDQQLEGNVLRIATRETLTKEAQQRRDLAKAEAEAAPVVTTTRVLSYAKASDVRDTLKRFLSSRGDILADARSNTLIISDIPTVIPTLDNLIRQLDRKSQQVEIEARVVVATRAFARDIGTQFGFAVAGATNNFRNVFGGASEIGVSPVVRNLPLPAPPLVGSSIGIGTTIPGVLGQPIPLNSNLQALSPTSGVTFSHSERNLALDFIITAAETKGVGRLLSKPKVITQNNETATVKQGTKIPVQTVINNTISVQFIDAVLRLQVTPQITADGNVFMDVVVENTQIDPAIPRVQGIPALDTQSAETKVLIGDGGTVVIGGIIISSQRTDISQVPLFGSIPVIGHLFRRTNVTTQSQELLFFLTPRILPS